jgi:DNA-directed RNA polymerase specialized sigma24 family protein
VTARLGEVLPEIWEEVMEEYFEKLWKSLPDWVAAVNNAKGWYTRY